MTVNCTAVIVQGRDCRSQWNCFVKVSMTECCVLTIWLAANWVLMWWCPMWWWNPPRKFQEISWNLKKMQSLTYFVAWTPFFFQPSFPPCSSLCETSPCSWGFQLCALKICNVRSVSSLGMSMDLPASCIHACVNQNLCNTCVYTCLNQPWPWTMNSLFRSGVSNVIGDRYCKGSPPGSVIVIPKDEHMHYSW